MYKRSPCDATNIEGPLWTCKMPLCTPYGHRTESLQRPVMSLTKNNIRNCVAICRNTYKWDSLVCMIGVFKAWTLVNHISYWTSSTINTSNQTYVDLQLPSKYRFVGNHAFYLRKIIQIVFTLRESGYMITKRNAMSLTIILPSYGEGALLSDRWVKVPSALQLPAKWDDKQCGHESRIGKDYDVMYTRDIY